MNKKNNMLIAVLATVFAGCASSGSMIRDSLDPVTSITVTHAHLPIVFFRDSYLRATTSHDFVSVGPLKTNLMGEYNYFLWLAIWDTTLDAHMADEQYGFVSIILMLDGEPLELSVAGSMPSVIGASKSVYSRPFASAAELYYQVTVEQLRRIAEAAEIRLLSSGAEAREYVLWDSPELVKERMQAFLAYVGY